MMLWDIIRDFIVQNITGGTLSNGNMVTTIWGHVVAYYQGSVDDTYTAGNGDILYKVFEDGEGFSGYIGAGDWLATTITIVAMCLIVVFAIWLVRWVFKAVTSAFLLRR